MEDRADGSGQRFLKTKNLLDFQADDVLKAYTRKGFLFAWDTGCGKSVGAISWVLASIQQGTADMALVICERNKLREWKADFEEETDLTVRIHHGPNRWKQMEKHQLPQVLITTYETAKLDGVVSKGPRSLASGRLMQALDSAWGYKTVVVYDEVAKLRNRSSKTYKAHHHMIKTLCQAGVVVKVLGLTGTPIEKGYEDGFNQLRILVDDMPTVKSFEDDYVRFRDQFGRPSYKYENIHTFLDLVRPHMARRRKTDPDVIEQFPPLTENYRYVEMGQAQKDFYRVIEDLALEEAEEGSMASWGVLRMAAGHPPALAYSERALAQRVVTVLGTDHVRNLPSAKAEELMHYLRPIILDQEAKALVFTFFGQSILRDLKARLDAEGLQVFTYHGGQSAAMNEEEKDLFKGWRGGAVLLASDAAARGINLPEATHVIEYESATTHATRIQRRDRAHRLGSKHGPVTAMTFITEGTIEEQIMQSVLARNGQSDAFLGDADGVTEDFVSADDRRAMLEMAKRIRGKRK